MSVRIRPIKTNELETFQETMGMVFGCDPTAEIAERFERVFELERLRGAFDGDQMIATFGAFSFQLTVPGGLVRTAGTTVVTVVPTHRRQGVLRTLMQDHLKEVHQNNEPLAALWASESSIYGRFGYGPASERAIMNLDRPFARLTHPVNLKDSMRLIDQDEALKVLPDLYGRIMADRPGMFQRTISWWEHRLLRDPEFKRQGWTKHRRAIHYRDGQPAGYVIYRTNTDSGHLPSRVQIVELMGIDPLAEKALWQFIFGIDLVNSINHWNQPVDDPVRWWLEEPRRMERKIEDALWLRPVDVLSALGARRYSSSGTIVVRFRDELCPWNDGVFCLEVKSDGSADCRPSDAVPEIEMGPFALGAVYLGGSRFVDLARAGLVTGRVNAIKLADAMFTWNRQPWCQEIF